MKLIRQTDLQTSLARCQIVILPAILIIFLTLYKFAFVTNRCILTDSMPDRLYEYSLISRVS